MKPLNYEKDLQNIKALSEKLPSHIWLKATRIEASEAHVAKSYLSKLEWKMYAEFKKEARKDSFLAGRRVLKDLLIEKLGLNLADIRLEILESGALALADSPFYISITHGREWTVAAVAPFPIGIDIEFIRPVNPLLKNRLLHATEMEGFNKLDLPLADKILQVWSMKEAYLKAIQTGFRTAAKSFAIHQNQIHHQGKTWQLAVERCEGYWLSVCWEKQ